MLEAETGMRITQPSAPPSWTSITVLVVNPSVDDVATLRAIFARSNWMLHCVSGVREAQWWMKRGTTPIIICERQLPDGDWRALMRAAEAGVYPPRFIVSSRLADDHLWAEVLNLGGYDVLCTPFETREVLHSVRSAWDSWQQHRGARSRTVFAAALAGSDVPPAA
jgi:DNA-binding response OmpR family regulator